MTYEASFHKSLLFYGYALWYIYSMGKTKRNVDCKKIEKLIPVYLNNKLSPYEMLALLNHIQECKSCKEELTIQYMVSEGLDRAESEDNYDLLTGLEERIRESYEQIRAHEFVYFGFTFALICVVCIVGIAFFKVVM